MSIPSKIKSKIILLFTNPVKFYRIVEHKLLRLVFRLRNRPEAYSSLVSGKIGLEIGGPSQFFEGNGFIPLYRNVTLDGCNFASSTIWEGRISEGKTFNCEGKVGHQFIAEATELKPIRSGSYDFVLSCNSIEHIANPLKALNDWVRVLKPDGILIIVAPRKQSNFDHRRPTTKFQHLISDFEKNTGEDDTTHVDEVLRLHDRSLDPGVETFEQFKERTLKVSEYRAVHHHVYDLKLLRQVFEHFRINVLMTDNIGSDYIIAGRKQGE